MYRVVVILTMMMMTLVAGAQEPADTTRTSQRALLTSYINKYDLFFHEALLQMQKGKLDAAFDLLSRCHELRPNAPETYYYLGQLYAEMDHDSVAREYFVQACKLEPTNITFMEQLAQVYVQGQNYAEAARVVNRMYEADPSRQDLLKALYQLYFNEKDYDKAIEVLNRMEAADGPTERITLSKCRIYIEQDDADHAISEMKKLADHYPNDPTYRTLYANTLLVTNHDDEAYCELMKVLADDSANLRAQQVMRNYYIRQGDETAADSVNHAILINPAASVEDKVEQLRQIIIENEQQGGDSSLVLHLFGELLSQSPSADMADIAEMKAAYMQLKDMPEESVQQAYEYVLQLAPDQASARLRLVQQAWEAKDDARIISLCQAARQYNPEEMVFYYYQGMAYYRQEDTDNALETFRNGINVINEDSRPEIVSDFYAVMGDLLHQKGREAEAFAAYDSCLVWKEDNIGCLNNYAYYLSLQNTRLDEAEHMSYRTIKAEPENATYLDTYAWILFMQKRYAEAKVYIEQALQHDDQPGAVVDEHAGDIFALCGDMDNALLQWQKALEQDPDNKLLAKKIKRKKYIKK